MNWLTLARAFLSGGLSALQGARGAKKPTAEDARCDAERVRQDIDAIERAQLAEFEEAKRRQSTKP